MELVPLVSLVSSFFWNTVLIPRNASLVILKGLFSKAVKI
jgi:hypothetical protein